MKATKKRTGKKLAALLLSILAVVGVLLVTATAADGFQITAKLTPTVTVQMDGQTQTFYNVNGEEVSPIIYEGSVYLPVRAIGELMGMDVSWDSATSTVSLTTSGDTAAAAASTGTATTSTASGTTTSGLLTEVEARAKALAHAGIAESQATFTKTKLDYEDGRQVYDVEFYANSTEYDYEIDAQTGEVVSYSQDVKAAASTSTSTGTTLTQDEAQAIALAQVSGADASHVTKCKLDRDDGRTVYEVEIRYNAMEYDFEIDAYTGTILERDVESIYS